MKRKVLPATRSSYIKRHISIVKMIVFLLLLAVLSSCNLKDKKTAIKIIDPERHYYPILRGQELEVVYQLENTGEYPLFITNIHTSCGCILVDDASFKVLPAGGKGFVKIKYDSSKNIGYVKHYITIYANLETQTKEELSFDLNVVPNALYTRDYEELYEQRKEKGLNEKDLVDGNEVNLGYYTDNP